MRTKNRRGRGRLPKNMSSYKSKGIVEYLSGIAIKHQIEGEALLQCISKAQTQTKAKCKKLLIVCREKSSDAAIYQFSVNEKILAQFSIPDIILQGTKQFERYMKSIVEQNKSKMGNESQKRQIQDLKIGMRKVEIEVKVEEIPESKMVYTRFGEPAYVANALVSDDTGSIRICLWNQQIQMISQGDTIKIENGIVSSFRGEAQLRLGRKGVLTVQKGKTKVPT